MRYSSGRQDANKELRLSFSSIASLGESLTKRQFNARSMRIGIHDGRIAIANCHLSSAKEAEVRYPRVNGSIAKLLDKGFDSRHGHVALRSKADDGPRTKFSTSTNLLSNQIPNTIYRSQQALLLGSLVVLDLWNWKDAGVDNVRFRFDFQAPFIEILLVR
jgi:hypothetical protein